MLKQSTSRSSERVGVPFCPVSARDTIASSENSESDPEIES